MHPTVHSALDFRGEATSEVARSNAANRVLTKSRPGLGGFLKAMDAVCVLLLMIEILHDPTC